MSAGNCAASLFTVFGIFDLVAIELIEAEELESRCNFSSKTLRDPNSDGGRNSDGILWHCNER